MAATAAVALSSSFPHLPAGRRQRRQRLRQRHQSGGGPRTAHAPRGLPLEPWRAPRRRRAQGGDGARGREGAQVESRGGGRRVSHPKEAGGEEQRRSRNDVAGPAPSSVGCVCSYGNGRAAPREARRWAAGWVAAPPLRSVPLLPRPPGSACAAATFPDNQTRHDLLNTSPSYNPLAQGKSGKFPPSR